MTRNPFRGLAEQRLFWRFTVLSFLAFTAITIFLLAAIRPAIENFVVTEQERQAVVFINRYAERNLTHEDFFYPPSSVAIAGLSQFLDDLPVPGVVQAVLLDPQGRVLRATAEPDAAYVAWATQQPGFGAAVRNLTASVGFADLDPRLAPGGLTQGLVMYVPITIGEDATPVAVLNILSRTGFISEAIASTERDLGTRIVFSLVGLYLILSIIVYGASRTIVRQNRELVAAATSLRQSLAREKELSAVKEKFVEIASHQLKTPVSEIGWALEIAGDPKVAKADLRDALASISAGHHALQSIIFDLLTVTEIGFSYRMRDPAPVHLDALTRRVIGQLAEFAGEKEIVISFKPAPGLPEAWGSAVALEHAIRNLLDNAVTYSNDGAHVFVDIRAERGGVAWEVRDQGIGVPPEDRGALFRQFFRARNAVEKKNVGTGLGLFIAKTVVEGHGGQIRHQPTPSGVGSSFVFWLPARPR